MNISPIERLTLISLKLIEKDGWEYELRYSNGKYTFIAWKSEWVTNNLYNSVSCIGGGEHESMISAISETMNLLKDVP